MLKSKLLRTVSLIMVTVGLLVLGSTTAFAQSKTVTGKVVDANGPVIGAFVMEQGTNTGASTKECPFLYPIHPIYRRVPLYMKAS